MSRPVTISMIVPIYRVEKFIGRFAESVFGQSYPHIQFIFVNDETDDSSVEVLNTLIQTKYIHLKDRVRIVHQAHAGLPSARKKGLEYAEGDYIWHLDSDDWIEEGAAEKIAECAGRTDADIIYFNFYRECGDKVKLEQEGDYDSSQKLLYQRNIYNHRAYGCVWNKCVKRELYLTNVVHFPEYPQAEDAFLMIQMIGYADSIIHLDEALYHYMTDNPASLTKQGRKRRVNELLLNFMSLCELHQETPDNPVAEIMDDIYFRAGRGSLIYRLGLFDRYPCLAENIVQAKVSRDNYVSVPTQIFLKMYARFRSRV